VNIILASLGLFIIAFTMLFLPPPGLSPILSSPYQDIAVIAIKTPDYAIKMGYPKMVHFYEPYVKERWGYAYKDLINESFTKEGLYDYARNRIITPEEIEAGLIVGYTGQIRLSVGELSWPKLIGYAIGVGLVAAGFSASNAVVKERRVEAEISA